MENDPKPYKFMKESIKKQPPDWKKIVLLIAGWLALAALGGLVAAAVFAVTEPKIAEAVTREEPPAKVDIPGDEDPNSGQEPDKTITASSASASVDSSGSGSEISSSTVDSSTSESSVSESTVSESTEENGAAEGTESSTSEEPEEGSEVSSVDGETDAEEKDSSLKNYEALYQDMLEVTEKPKRALVTVIGITNQMDYFNQNYENQQQISGLIVADNGQDLFILTEYRIVENVERIQVTFWDETMVDATYQRHDPSTGLTIVKVDESKLDEETRDGLAVAPLGTFVLNGTILFYRFQPVIGTFEVNSVSGFVTQRPNDDGRMVLRTLVHTVCTIHVCCQPSAVLGKRSRTVAHTVRLDVGLVDHIKSVAIAKLIPVRMSGIM